MRCASALDALPRHGKSNYGAPAYSRYINRPVGRRLAAAAFATGMTPNQVTGISMAFSFTGIVLLVLLPPTAALGIGVSLLLAIGYAFDSADGQLARRPGGRRMARPHR